MKIVTKFIGNVTEYNEPPELSYVTLKNIDNGEERKTTAISEKIKEKGITFTGCEFEVIIMEDLEGKVTATLTKLESHKLVESETEIKPSENFDI